MLKNPGDLSVASIRCHVIIHSSISTIPISAHAMDQKGGGSASNDSARGGPARVGGEKSRAAGQDVPGKQREGGPSI